jgi:hypothetical protein
MNVPDVYLSFTTIPSRIARTVFIVRNLLQHLEQSKISFTKLFLSIPLIYRLPKHGIAPLKYIIELQQLERKSQGKFKLIRPFIDYGPLTKLLPVVESAAKYQIQMDNSILVIFDDECYHVELIQQAIQHQLENLKTSFTYYQYPYKALQVPQGVDLITFYMKHLKDFPAYERQVILKDLDSSCFYVDDLVIANYLKLKQIPIQTLDRGNYNLPWTPNCIVKDTHSLHLAEGAHNRRDMMQKCYRNIA